MRMRALASIALVAATFLAGCSTRGEDESSDPWAYTRKPLYTGGFDLAELAGANETQSFRVTDGSIGAIRAQVWINATAGGATVTLRDPSGRAILTTTETTDQRFGLNLGQWSVAIEGLPDSSGLVHVLVTRA